MVSVRSLILRTVAENLSPGMETSFAASRISRPGSLNTYAWSVPSSMVKSHVLTKLAGQHSASYCSAAAVHLHRTDVGLSMVLDEAFAM
jgi:hypothetical protein